MRPPLDRLGDDRDWRLWWHRGLTALARGRATEAVDWLDAVYTELPGEVPAKLALALAHEQAGDLARSAGLYDTASRTDPSYVSGGFGLARVRWPWATARARSRPGPGAGGLQCTCRRPPRRRACPRLDDLCRAADGRASRGRRPS